MLTIRGFLQNTSGLVIAVILFCGLLNPVQAQVIDFFMGESSTPQRQQDQEASEPTNTPLPTASPSASILQQPTGTITPVPTATATAQLTPGAYVTNGTDTTVVRDGDYLYIGGIFTRVELATGSAAMRNHLAAIDVPQNTILDWNPNPNAPVDAIATDDIRIYVGGKFTEISGQSRPYIAAYNKQTLELFSWNPIPNDHVYAIAVDDTYIYVGGRFTAIGGKNRLHFAVFDRISGNITDYVLDANGDIYALATDDTYLYIGGTFTEIGGQQRRYLTAVDKSNGQLTNWQPQLNNEVRRINLTSQGVVVIGPFMQVDGQNRNFRAVINPSTGAVDQFETVDPNQPGGTLTVTVKIDQNALGFRIPNLSDILTFVIRLFFVLAGLVALLYLLLGAFAWITSGGEEENTTKARNKITAAIIGVVLIVAVLAIIVTLEQVVFRERICFGISCAASIPNLIEPCGTDIGIDCDAQQ